MNLIKCNLILLACLVGVSQLKTSYAEDEARSSLTHKIYISGIVHDTNEIGVADVAITIERDNHKIMFLRSLNDGWFEAIEPIDVPENGLNIRIVLNKPGYQFTDYVRVLNNNNFHYNLKLPLLNIDYSSITDKDESASTLLWHGHLQDPLLNNTALPGAKLSLFIDDQLVDITLSKINGYFTLEYDKKLQAKPKTLTVEHPKFDFFQIPQNTSDAVFVPTSPMKKRLDLDWLIRTSFVIPGRDALGEYNPLKPEINYIGIYKLVLKDIDPNKFRIYKQCKIFNYNFSQGMQNTKNSHIFFYQFGYSWKSASVIGMDFSVGKAKLYKKNSAVRENNVQIQIGVYTPMIGQEFIKVPWLRLRLEVAAFRENGNNMINATIGVEM